MARPFRIWPAAVTFLAAIALEITPLPDALQAIRPPLATMALIYWVMMRPERFGLMVGFGLGIVLDILHGHLLGQNALALSVVSYIALRFHLQIRIFPIWQMTMTVLALLTIATSIQFVIDGIAGFGTLSMARWPQVLVGAILWPPVMALLDRVRTQSEAPSSNF